MRDALARLLRAIGELPTDAPLPVYELVNRANRFCEEKERAERELMEYFRLLPPGPNDDDIPF